MAIKSSSLEEPELKTPEYWMQQALLLAQAAAENNEVPVGAVVVLNGEIIGRGSNGPIHRQDPTAHAEILALREAAQNVANYRLINADLYVTLEPCAMCAGALLHSRIKNLYFGAHELKSGAVESHLQLFKQDCMNHQINVFSGIEAQRCGQVLSDFFRRRRQEKKLSRQLK